MGQGASSDLEQFKSISNCEAGRLCCFPLAPHGGVPLVSETELKRLWRRFKKLDKDNSGTLTADEFLSVPELACNPLLERVIAIFDTNKDDEIEFKEFIGALSTFSEKGNTESKLRYAGCLDVGCWCFADCLR
jgi:hypothetical protein